MYTKEDNISGRILFCLIESFAEYPAGNPSIYKEKARLKRVDLLKLLLTPLMGGTMPQKEWICRGMQLLRREREHLSKEEQMQMEAVLYTFALKFLTKTD